jgi:CRP/FNR family cyclic AMP-dependent transcriptional regulator
MTRPDDPTAHRLEAREREEHWLHSQPLPLAGLATAASPTLAEPPAPPAVLSPLMHRLARRGPARHWRRQMLIAQAGERAHALWLILDGQVAAFSAGRTGREVVHARHGPGTLLGEALLLGQPHPCCLVTLTSVCVTVLTPQALEAFALEHPAWWREWQAQLLGRLGHCTRHAGRLAVDDTAARLAAVLQELARPEPDGAWRIRPRPTHAELAALTGCSREMVTRLLKAMAAAGRLRLEPQAWCLPPAPPDVAGPA